MFHPEDYIQRLDRVLDEMDALAHTLRGDARETLEDMNAELEDLLALLRQTDPQGADANEELSQIREDMTALAMDYEEMAASVPALREAARHLKAVVMPAEGE